MTPSTRLALEIALSTKALKIGVGALYRPFPKRVADVSIGFHGRLLARLVNEGLLRWVNKCRSAAVLTDAGRAMLADAKGGAA